MKKNIEKTKLQSSTLATKPFSFEQQIHWFLMLGALILYGWTYTFDFGLDDSYITGQLAKIGTGFNDFLSIFTRWYDGSDYRPITIVFFWLERKLFGEINPGTSHLLNAILYGFLVMKLFKFLVLLKPFNDENKDKLFAFLVAIIFLVHPNHVSVVANIKSRDNLLSMTFGVLAIIQFLKGWDNKQYYRYFLFFLFYLLGHLSKFDAYSFVYFPLFIIPFFRIESVNFKSAIINIIIFLIAYGLVSFLKVEMLRLPSSRGDMMMVMSDPGENPLALANTWPNKISMCLVSLFYYIKFCVFPFQYYFFYGYNQIPLRPLFHPFNIFVFSFCFSAIVFAIYYFKRNKIYLFSFLFFGMAIAYALNLFNIVAGIVANRYNFIASLGFCLALSALLIELLKLKTIKDIFNKFIIGLLLFYSIITFYHTSGWKDSLTLYLRDIPHLENSYNANRIVSAAYVNLGLEYEYTKPAEGEEYFKKADEYADIAHKVYQNAGATWTIKGICQLHWNDNRKALEYFLKSEKVDSTFYSGVNYVGVAYRNLGITDSAYMYFHKVMLKESFYSYSADNLINWYIDNGKMDKLDSLTQYYLKRFPDDLWLKERMLDLRKHGHIE